MTKPTVELEPVHPKPAEAAHMPYAPAVRIVGACDLMFISGATPSPLYHRHPHVDAEHVHPHDIGEQTRRAMDSIKLILDHVGAGFHDLVRQPAQLARRAGRTRHDRGVAEEINDVHPPAASPAHSRRRVSALL